MALNEPLLMEYELESGKTRKILERLPDEKFDWKPHDKSFSLGGLAAHIAEIPMWMDVTLNTDELDFSKFEYKPPTATNREEVLKLFDENVAKAKDVLKNTSDETLLSNWTMRNGEQVYFTAPKIGVVRDFIYNHTVHHRAQLGVYLRLNDVPVPMMYGPTADEQM